jgi:hypothetical protein
MVASGFFLTELFDFAGQWAVVAAESIADQRAVSILVHAHSLYAQAEGTQRVDIHASI